MKYKVLKEAKELLPYLEYEEKLRSVKTRWLVRKWPEFSCFTHSSTCSTECGFLTDQYISETLMRDDNSIHILKKKIKRGFDPFRNASDQRSLEETNLRPESIQLLPKGELFHYLPTLLQSFRLAVLRSLVEIVTGTPYKSMKDKTIKKIMNGLRSSQNESDDKVSCSLEKIEHIIRDPNSISETCKAIVLKNIKKSWLKTSESLLDQLEVFPEHTLRTMLNRLLGEPSGIRGGLTLKKKVALLSNIRKHASKFLKVTNKRGPLPEPLRKAFIVACLSVRQMEGDDGGLSERLGTVSDDIKAKQNEFLYAISHVKELSHSNLSEAYNCLFSGNSSKDLSEKQMRSIVVQTLTEWLFEISEGDIPDTVTSCVRLVCKRKNVKIQSRVEAELESVQNVSSHIQQIMYDHFEKIGLSVLSSDDDLDGPEEACEPWFEDNSCKSVTLDKDEDYYVGECMDFSVPKNEKRTRQGYKKQCHEGKESTEYSEIENDRREEKSRSKIIQDIGDETGLFAYHLMGCMADEVLRRKQVGLDPPVKLYLRTGLDDVTGSKETEKQNDQDDISLLLDIAKKVLPDHLERDGVERLIKKVKLSLDAI